MKALSFSPAVLFISAFSMLLAQAGYAGSATWSQTPVDSEWTTAAYWTPATVPNGPIDVATFATSTSLNPLVDSNIEVDSIVFNPGASVFTVTVNSSTAILTLSGGGVTNESGQTQHFSTKTSTGQIQFINSASAGARDILYSNRAVAGDAGTTSFFDTTTAGSAVFDNAGSNLTNGPAGSTQFYGDSTAGDATFTNEVSHSFYPGGFISFNDNSTAGNGTFINNSSANIYFYDTSTADNGTFTNAGTITFYENSTAGNATFNNKVTLQFFNSASAENATITNEGATVSGTSGGLTLFVDASAANATIVNNGSTVESISGAATVFNAGGKAENSVLIANGGVGSNLGGTIYFEGDSDGGTSRNEVFGNGTLYLGYQTPPGVTVGSVEGNGIVELGANNLTVGSNNLSTTFSGIIQDGDLGPGGSLTKIGMGKLTLTNANTYTGGTTVNGGILLANNGSGSATGRGLVQVISGTLGGSGTISGAVTMGTGSGPGAFLGPGASGVIPGTLTIRKNLNLLADATYRVTVNSTGYGEGDRQRSTNSRCADPFQ
jgi:autotransporter-associated beta strand protein